MRAPCVSATPVQICCMACWVRSRTAGSSERVVPRSTTDSGITFRVAAVDLRDADHHRVVGVGAAAGDGLQRHHQLGRDHHGSMRGGLGAVRALAGDGDLEVVEEGGHGAGADGELPRGSWGSCACRRRRRRELVEQALLHHHAAAAPFSSAGWKTKCTVPRKGLWRASGGRAEQHGGVAVVPAGVHLAGAGGGVRSAAELLHIERVEVGAQRDAGALAVAQGADHAGGGQAAVDLDPHQFERMRHDIGGAVLLEGGFGRGGCRAASPPCSGGCRRRCQGRGTWLLGLLEVLVCWKS